MPNLSLFVAAKKQAKDVHHWMSVARPTEDRCAKGFAYIRPISKSSIE